jgi:hypothetical protein
VRRRVDEVGEGDERGGEADHGPVERRDQDLGVRVEGLGDVEVEGDEGLEPEFVGGGGFCGGLGGGLVWVGDMYVLTRFLLVGGGAGDGDVGTAVVLLLV